VTWLSDEAVGRLRDVAVAPELPADRYELLHPIGRGGMGSVHAARDTRLDRLVAVKVSNSAAPSTDLERRLTQEARVLARLEHPGIVPVHDAGVLGDGRWYYVMKLVRGETLASRPPDRGDEAAVLGVFERIVETAAFAHASGVVHRDLTPSNVMLGSFGEVLVLDWGVARILDETVRGERFAVRGSGSTNDDHRAGLTAGDTRMGTPGFMAPEQARGEAAAAGTEADVYSLGALLFWMLTGEAPTADAEASARRLRQGPHARSKRLAGIVRTCLAASPDARYPDAAALRDDLGRYRAGAPVTAYRDSPIERLGHWAYTYRTFILLVLTYLVMRALFAYWQS
jgi:serine/threonine protein kinase